MLGPLCPSVATLHLPAPVMAAAHFLRPWWALRSLQLDDMQQTDVAAVAQLTQLQTLSLNCGAEQTLISMRCLTALSGLRSSALQGIRLAGRWLRLAAASPSFSCKSLACSPCDELAVAIAIWAHRHIYILYRH